MSIAQRICPKCECGWTFQKYMHNDIGEEVLRQHCTGCGYWWDEPCADAKKNPTAQEPRR